MSDSASAVLWFAFLLAIVGCIPYAIWVLYSALKRRWKRVAIQVSALLAVFLAFHLVFSVRHAKAYAAYLAGVFDTDVRLGKALYEYDSPRAFNGDGYSFSVYELPAGIRTRFASADQRLLTEFPKRPDYRRHWVSHPWREAPFDPTLQRYLDFALSTYDERNAKGLSAQFDAIRDVLSRRRTYYALFSNSHMDRPADIDLFIVDLERGRLYVINHNT